MLSDALVIVLYISLIIFVITLIVLVIKLMDTLNRANKLIDNLQKKAESLDSLFNIFDFTTNKFSLIGETISTYVLGFVKKLFGKKEREEESYE
mgnify:FL=1